MKPIATPVTVELSEMMLDQLDTICARYDVTRPEALRLSITLAMRQFGQKQPESKAAIAEAIDKLLVANSDIETAIKRIARVTLR